MAKITSASCGLSPRVRGNRDRPPDVVPRLRSIPACAGEPARLRAVAGQPQVYPRVCGGTCPAMLVPAYFSGLSPRVRGNLDAGLRRRRGIRSIPACAGEPVACSAARCAGTVYPRVCGGTAVPQPFPFAVPGLSPRVRGNRLCTAIMYTSAGSIPACAGEPGGRHSGKPACQVYPRVCGGTNDNGHEQWAYIGLSPRVRGNLRLLLQLPGAVGSIPACAGEPPSRPPASPLATVYPRVCGGT